MKFCLPKKIRVFAVFLIFIVFFVGLLTTAVPVFAAPTDPAAPGTDAAPVAPQPTTVPGWHADPEVTFVGKSASRSAQFIDWTLQNYNWLCVKSVVINEKQLQCDNTNNPLLTFWATIRNIVYSVLAIFVLVTAFIIIITRGQNITVMKFVPRFVMIVVLITFSFTLIQFIYTITDVTQGFFLRNGDGSYISTKDLLYMGFNYNFQGYRYTDDLGTYDESAFVSLLLVRLTAITYYVMTGVLIVRKIILWFFIIISPIFPLLIFYKPLRNTAKIWLGEFLRWLLYAPIFAVFLQGLVVVWRAGIPLAFHLEDANAGKIVYPTAISILLGGPGTRIFYDSIEKSNSVNLPDSFALYVVALLMLWVVILLPFLLLKIFLDYLGTISFDSNLWLQKIKTRQLPFTSPPGAAPQVPPTPPGQTQPMGAAKSLPFFATRQAAVPVQYQASVQSHVRESSDILRSANLSVPRMRDIAAYETSMMSQRSSTHSQAVNVNSTLAKIANPASATTTAEREKFSTVREKLLAQKQKGNPIAASVLSASQVTSTSASTYATTAPAQANSVVVRKEQTEHVNKMLNAIAHPELALNIAEKEQAAKLRTELLSKKEKGDTLAASILETQDTLSKTTVTEKKEEIENKLINELLEADKKGDTLASQFLPKKQTTTSHESLPMVNHVQQVSLEDYEEVRKLWSENYETLEPPKGLNGEQVDRREWIKNDIDKINQAITLLSGVDPARVNQGMSMVSSILPFLLIGGFSKSEVVAYLKAKMEAGKEVLNTISKKETEEESMVERKTATTTEAGHAEASAALPIDEPKPENAPKSIDEAKFLGDEEKQGQNGGNSGTQI